MLETKNERDDFERERNNPNAIRNRGKGSTQMRKVIQSDSCWLRSPGSPHSYSRPAEATVTAVAGKIALLLPETQTTRYESDDRPNFEAAVEDQCPDCDVLYYNADQDVANQQSQVETAITEGVDVMVLDPVDSASAGGLATRAKDAGIPVVSYDRLVLDADLDYYVSFDSVTVGEQQGDSLSKKLADDGNPQGPIVMINGDPQDNNAKLFKEGATSVFDKGRRDRARVRYA